MMILGIDKALLIINFNYDSLPYKFVRHKNQITLEIMASRNKNIFPLGIGRFKNN